MTRRAKIVCTLGPATSSEEAVWSLVEAGMDCARLNFSHGHHDGHKQLTDLVRRAASRARRPIALLADLCGPKLRVGTLEGGAARLDAGASFVLTPNPVQGDATRASVSYADLPRDVSEGDPILLDDGLIRLAVREVRGDEVYCEVCVGGVLTDRKGMNLPATQLSLPALTDKDRADLAFARDELHVDYFALSFVRSANDVREAQTLAGDIPVIAKMEKPEAIDRMDEILDVADGAMVARGDLGVELAPEKVPLIQKTLIREVNRRGKIVITATQMLDSMIRNPRPTRAEVADVANAVLDGTDALMLSGETAAGAYASESVRMMDVIIREAESSHLADAGAQHDRDVSTITEWEGWQFANAAARAAALLTFVIPVKAVVVFSESGRSVSLLSEYRPKAPIVAVTRTPRVANRLALEWGVLPFVEVPPEDMEETLRTASALLVREKLCTAGDAAVIVTGWPPSSSTNAVKLHRV